MMTRSKMYRSKMTQADMTQPNTLQNQFDDQNRDIQFVLGVNTIWTSAIVVMALRSQFVMLLLKIYLAINLAYNYNPFVIGINIFNRLNAVLWFVYKMADDFMWKHSLEPEEEEEVDTDSQMSSAEEEIRYEFSEEEDNDSSSEEEDNDSSSDYEEWVFKRPCKKADATKADATKADATKADATKADATKADATKADATETYENDADDEADDLSPLFTCSVCEISTRNPYVKFVVFCGKEYCGTCSTKALYTTPLNEVDAYLLSEYKKHDGWYDPETSTFHIGFWINNEFVPIMDDIRNVHRYGNKEEDADSPKEDTNSPKEDTNSPKEDADCPKEDADCPKEDDDSSEEEDNDSSSDYADDDYMKYIPKDLVFPEDKAEDKVEDNVKSEETSSDDFNIHDFSEIL